GDGGGRRRSEGGERQGSGILPATHSPNIPGNVGGAGRVAGRRILLSSAWRLHVARSERGIFCRFAVQLVLPAEHRIFRSGCRHAAALAHVVTVGRRTVLSRLASTFGSVLLYCSERSCRHCSFRWRDCYRRPVAERSTNRH